MKICPNCKNQFPDDTNFCADCGTNISDVAPVESAPSPTTAPAEESAVQASAEQPQVQEESVPEATVQTEAPARAESPASIPESDPKKSPVKMIAIIAAVAVIFLITVISMAYAFSGGSDFIELKNAYSAFSNYDGDSVIVFNAKDVVTLDGSASGYYSNLDRTGVYALVDGDLKLVTKDGDTDIDSDVVDFTASLDRESVVYTKIDDEDEGTVELYRWNGKESVLIDSEVFAEVMAISPNCDAIAYIKDMSEDGDEFDTYISKNGKAGEIVDDLEDRAILSISDDAKTTVVLDLEKEDVFIVKGKKETKLSSADEIGSMYFNQDQSELLFVSNDKLYFCKNVGEREKVANDISSISICVPDNKAIQSAYGLNSATNIVTYDIDSFADMTLFADDTDGEYNIISFSKKLEVTTLAKNVSSYVLTENEKTLFYIKNSDIYKMKAGKPDSAEKIASDVMAYEISPDGKHIYYTNDDEELCYVNGKKIEIVGEDASYLRMSENGYLYYIEDRDSDTYIGDLYCVKGKGKSEAVEGGEDTYSVRTSAGKVIFVSDYDTEDHIGTLYVANGKKSVHLAEEIRG